MFNWFKDLWSGNNFGRFIFKWLNTTPVFNTYADDLKKITAVFKNPALLKVFALQCDLFSLAQIKVVDKNGKEIPDDPAGKLLDAPNPMQNRTQFLWDFMFWNMLGNDYCYVDSKIAEKLNNKLYFLEPQKLDWPTQMQKNSDKLILSASSLTDMLNTQIPYRYNDGSLIKIPLKQIIFMSDLTNGVGNFFKGPSRIDALYKIIANSEASLDAKNINTRMSGQFMVSGKQDPENITQLPLSGDEKESIEGTISTDKPVTAVKSMIDIKRFVDNMANLKLDDSFLADYYLIGTMYGIPRDVLEAYQSSTYENQEKARASHVSYTLQPKGEDFMSALGKYFGYNADGRTIKISWSHLPFMQVFEAEKAKTQKDKSVAFANFLNAGVSLDEVNGFLGTDFKTGDRNYVASSEIIRPAKGDQQQPAGKDSAGQSAN